MLGRASVSGSWRARRQRVTIDLDATLITSHSEKEGAAGTFKGGYGFHPMLAYATRPARRWPASCGPATPAPTPRPTRSRSLEQRARADPGRAHRGHRDRAARRLAPAPTHELLDFCRERPVALLGRLRAHRTGPRRDPQDRPRTRGSAALDQDGSERPNGQVAEITDRLDLSGWPAGSRVIVRRERAHPGAQLTFTDHDGHRFQATLTDQPDPDIADLERRHRAARARRRPHPQRQRHRPAQPALPRLRAQPRLAELVALAHDLIAWTQRLLLTGELAAPSPNACATDCCTSPRASLSTPAPQRCASKHAGPGRTRSPPRSRAQSAPRARLTRSQRARRPSPRTRRQRRDQRCPNDDPRTHRARSRDPKARPQRPTGPSAHQQTRRACRADSHHGATARSGLAVPLDGP